MEMKSKTENFSLLAMKSSFIIVCSIPAAPLQSYIKSTTSSKYTTFFVRNIKITISKDGSKQRSTKP